MARYRVTVDTGGTFSDFVHLNEQTGEISIAKIPSTPDDPSRAILAGSKPLAQRHRGCRHRLFLPRHHGGTNAAARRQGRQDRFAGTGGISRNLSVGEQARPYGTAIFDVMYDKPAPLVPAVSPAR
jgi:N-methylhydantoinase A